jgi:hypothetical protein
MAGDFAVAAAVAFSAGVMSGMVVTIVVAIRQDRSRDSLAGQSLEFLERTARRFMSTSLRQPTVHPDGQ